MLRRLLIPVIVGVSVAVPGAALATDYYVSNTCQYDGNGMAPTCAAAAGQTGVRNNLQTFLDNTRLQADDTVFIRAGNGAYVTTWNGGNVNAYWVAGFNIKGSGTAGHPITIRNYPGETPLLSNCADNQNAVWDCNNATVSIDGGSYIRITGLRIRGILQAHGTDTEQGIVIDHNDIYQGQGTGPGSNPPVATSGNWACLRLEHIVAPWVHHNYLHDTYPPLSGYTTDDWQARSTSCAKLYTSVGSTFEWNTFENCNAPGGSGGAAVDDKVDAVDNIYRYNHFISNGSAWRMMSATNKYPALAGESMHHNLIEPGTYVGQSTGCLYEEAGAPITGFDFYNNTCIASGPLSVGGGKAVGAVTTKVYNNVYYVSGTLNETWYATPILVNDYNLFTSGRYYSYPSGLAALAKVQALGYHQHSVELAYTISAFGFVSSSDFHLNSGSRARGFGRVGGVGTGAVLDAGAFEGMTQCVGHLCLAPPSDAKVR
jgi:hypothetical protein